MKSDDFEAELRAALKRTEPASGFAERVERAARKNELPRRRFAAWAVAASLLVGTFGVVRYEEYRRAEDAKNQLLLALHITAKTLDNVERKLNEQ